MHALLLGRLQGGRHVLDGGEDQVAGAALAAAAAPILTVARGLHKYMLQSSSYFHVIVNDGIEWQTIRK